MLTLTWRTWPFLGFISLCQILLSVRVDALGADELPHTIIVHRLPHHPSVSQNQPYNVSVNRGTDERGVKTGFEATLLDGSYWARATAVYPCRGLFIYLLIINTNKSHYSGCFFFSRWWLSYHIQFSSGTKVVWCATLKTSY